MGTVTENERRAEDMLNSRDLIVRGLAIVGLIAVVLVMLLATRGA
jgi:hypothetical protein